VVAKTWYHLKDKRHSFSFVAIPDERGRIVIPAYIRKRLGIKYHSPIIIIVSKALGGEKCGR
jgi:AbrB family looped-hinge helix DNA binding protein